MPIQAIRKENRLCPFVVCEHCRQPITNHWKGAVVTWTDDNPTPKFMHKGLCDLAFNRGKHTYWEELREWLVMLCHNSGLKTGDEFDSISEEQAALCL